MNNKIIAEKLKQYFYNRFKNTDFTKTKLDLYNINERERIINELAENQEEAYIFNAIYEKTLKEIETIFKNNDEYIKSKQIINTISEDEETSEEFKKQAEEKRNKYLKQKRKAYFLRQIKKKIPIIIFAIIIIIFIISYNKFAKPILNNNNIQNNSIVQNK